MQTIEIPLDDTIDKEEFKKSICFISPDIQSIQIKDEKIIVGISKQGDVNTIFENLQKMKEKYKINKQDVEVYYNFELQQKEFYDISRGCGIIFFGNGQVGFDQKGKFLLEWFDNVFLRFAKKLGAAEKIYPVMLPLEEYTMTGYIKKSPQYAIFCSSVQDSIGVLEMTNNAVQNKEVKNVIKEPEFALSPSACFHTYIEYRGKELEQDMLVTFKQNVFRNEGRLNYDETGRLCDYLVREIVMIGTQEYCLSIRDRIMECSVSLLKELGLQGDISIASDSFVVPKMQMYRKIQRIDKSKYEMHLYTSSENKISVASFNLHGKAFTDPFNIRVKDENTVTACVGFGLQRFVISFLSQFGYDENNWPDRVKRSYQLFRKSLSE
ncbi:MAG: hypothetical protein HFG39_12115 [Lachnospiraceae bacterium]|nr:hypothetical protein [Lachnospiraceae bacterium]